MKPRLLQYLACPSCYSDLKQHGDLLTCLGCPKTFPIIRGIPRFTADAEKNQEATAQNFGWQWQRFTQEDERYAAQFLGWLTPVKPEFFQGKVVLEGGCGKGRHTRLAAQWGAKDVIGVDLSDAVESAYQATEGYENAHIIQADIYNLPLKHNFDYAFSVGVLHHLPDPRRGFQQLVDRAEYVSAWVYGRENNGWIIYLVNPIRALTSKIPPALLYQLSKLPTALVYAATQLLYKRSDRLFYGAYLHHLSQFGWKEHHNIVFDHLVAPTAFYLPKAEFESWWQNARDVTVTWHNQNSWCGFGRFPSPRP